MGKCFEYSSNFIGSIPIKIIPESKQQPFIKLVDKMLLFKKQLNELSDIKTDKIIEEKSKVEEEIKKTNDQIDNLVYDLYGITDAEKKVIEESLK